MGTRPLGPQLQLLDCGLKRSLQRCWSQALADSSGAALSLYVRPQLRPARQQWRAG